MTLTSDRPSPSLSKLMLAALLSVALVFAPAFALALPAAAATDPNTQENVQPKLPIEVQPCVGEAKYEMRSHLLKSGGNAEKALLDGKLLFLNDNTGNSAISDGEMNSLQGVRGLPYCGSRVMPDGSVQSFWSFCTDKDKRGCMELPARPETGPGVWEDFPNGPKNPLSDQQRAKIAYILADADYSTMRSRSIIQTQVWCVSENIKPGTVYKDAIDYFKTYQDLLTDEEATCADIPEMPIDPELSVVAEQDVVFAEDTARFTVTTNLGTPIEVKTSTGDSVELCQTEQPGVSFDGKKLTFDSGGSATLCVNRDSGGEVRLSVDSGPVPTVGGIQQSWSGESDCQVFNTLIAASPVTRVDSATTRFVGQGSFEVEKLFEGDNPTNAELEDITVAINWSASVPTSVPAELRPAQTSGRLLLNNNNGFKATGPTLPTGTVVTLSEEWAGNNQPVTVRWEGASWQVNGVPSSAPHQVTIGDGQSQLATVAVSNELVATPGTFRVSKSFEGMQPGSGVEVVIGWRVDSGGSAASQSGTVLLNADNGFSQMPGPVGGPPTTFPIGTRILLWEEKTTGFEPGIVLQPDWGANSAGLDDQDRPLGSVTVSEPYIASEPASASLISLSNTVENRRATLAVEKLVRVGGVDTAEKPSGDLAGLTVEVLAEWNEGGQDLSVRTALNKSNDWRSGLGTTFAPGTEVTLSESGVFGVPTRYDQDSVAWSCDGVSGPCVENPDGSVTVTVSESETATVTATNTYQVVEGFFVLQKEFAAFSDETGETVVVDPADLEHAELTVKYTATGEGISRASTEGTLTLRYPDFKATSPNFPRGTKIALEPEDFDNIELPVSLDWESAVWSPEGAGGPSTPPTITIGDTAEAVEVTLTNQLTQKTGTFEVNKSFADLPEGVFKETLEITVAWEASTGESGELVLNQSNDWSAIPTLGDPSNCEVSRFPLGTEITFTETQVSGLPEGVTLDQSWGANEVPGSSPPQGRVVIAEQWQGCDDRGTATEIELVNGANDTRIGLSVQKLVSEGESDSALPDGALDALEITVLATWGDPEQTETILLNSNNGWNDGLGVMLAPGTEVTLEEIAIDGTPERFDWDSLTWSCEGVTSQCKQNDDGTLTVTVGTGSEDGNVAAITANNEYRIVQGMFDLTKTFTVLDYNGDAVAIDEELLAGVELNVGFTATGDGVDPGDAEGTLTLRYPDFAATSPNFPRGTVITLEPEKFQEDSLPFNLRWDDAVWNPYGEEGEQTPPTVIITGEDSGSVSVGLENMLTQLYGTFEVSKTFDGLASFPDLSATLRWDVAGDARDASTNILELNNDNDFRALPTVDGDVVLLPLGSVVELSEISVSGLPAGVYSEPDWGANAKPGYPNIGLVTVTSEYPAGASASPNTATLDNTVIDERATIEISKTIDEDSLGVAIGSEQLANLVVLVDATWVDEFDDLQEERLILNQFNDWRTGLGHLLPPGTKVTFSESMVIGGGPSIEWGESPIWTCTSPEGTSTCESDDQGRVTAVVGASDELSVNAENSGKILRGTFEVMKDIQGDITLERDEEGNLILDDPRLADTSFTVQWEAEGYLEDLPTSGTLVLDADNGWRASPEMPDGQEVQFPLGTIIRLTEIERTNTVPGLDWDDDLTWSVGGQVGGGALFAITEADTVAAIQLTNYAELHEGTFSIEKFINAVQGTPIGVDEFVVEYTDGTGYSGELVVRPGEVTQAPMFPAGTEITLTEIKPATPPNANDTWGAPTFVLADGTPVTGDVTLVVGDGQSARIDMINVVNPKPEIPQKPQLPVTGGVIAGALALGALLVGGGVALFQASKRRRRSI